MADDVTLPGTGAVVSADLVDLGSGNALVQMMKLVDGTNGGTERIPGTVARGLAVDPRLKVVRLSATPTVSTTPAYALKDAVGGLLTFANAVRASGGSGLLHAVQVVDKGQQMKDLELMLFDRSITAPTDNAVFDPTDTELTQSVGRVDLSAGYYSDFSDNSIATREGLGLEFVLNGTDLFGVLVARGTPTFTSTTDIVVTLTIVQD